MNAGIDFETKVLVKHDAVELFRRELNNRRWQCEPIMGPTNLPGALAVDASSLYARNLFNFISLMVDKKAGTLNLDWNDEIIKGSAVTKDGAPVSRG